MKKDDAVFLRDILDATNYIKGYIARVTYKRFLRNKMVQDAVMRQLEIIGEAARSVSMDLRRAHPSVEWEKIIGMRNRLIHAYNRVDLDIVWEVVQIDVPSVERQIEKILKEIAS